MRCLPTTFFSKKLAVIPLKTQSSEATANALKQIFEEDIGLPLQVYSDEGGEFVKNFSDKLKHYDVEQKYPEHHKHLLDVLYEQSTKSFETTENFVNS